MLDTSRLDHLLCVCETIVSKSNNPFWISESFVDGLLHKEELAGFFFVSLPHRPFRSFVLQIQGSCFFCGWGVECVVVEKRVKQWVWWCQNDERRFENQRQRRIRRD